MSSACLVWFGDFLLDSAPLLNEMSFPQTQTPSFDTNQEKTGVFRGFSCFVNP